MVMIYVFRLKSSIIYKWGETPTWNYFELDPGDNCCLYDALPTCVTSYHDFLWRTSRYLADFCPLHNNFHFLGDLLWNFPLVLPKSPDWVSGEKVIYWDPLRKLKWAKNSFPTITAPRAHNQANFSSILAAKSNDGDNDNDDDDDDDDDDETGGEEDNDDSGDRPWGGQS